MTTAEFIDVVLTPIGGGIGGAIGAYFGMRKRVAEKSFPRFGFVICGMLVAAVLAIIKLLDWS
jgi:phosphatidylserine decarboxylase